MNDEQKLEEEVAAKRRELEALRVLHYEQKLRLDIRNRLAFHFAPKRKALQEALASKHEREYMMGYQQAVKETIQAIYFKQSNGDIQAEMQSHGAMALILFGIFQDPGEQPWNHE